MAFIRRKIGTRGRQTYQVVKSVREGKHVHQEVLCCLRDFPTIGLALRAFDAFVSDTRACPKARQAYARRIVLLRQVRAATGLA